MAANADESRCHATIAALVEGRELRRISEYFETLNWPGKTAALFKCVEHGWTDGLAVLFDKGGDLNETLASGTRSRTKPRGSDTSTPSPGSSTEKAAGVFGWTFGAP